LWYGETHLSLRIWESMERKKNRKGKLSPLESKKLILIVHLLKDFSVSLKICFFWKGVFWNGKIFLSLQKSSLAMPKHFFYFFLQAKLSLVQCQKISNFIYLMLNVIKLFFSIICIGCKTCPTFGFAKNFTHLDLITYLL
jgi:hypothetical protein